MRLEAALRAGLGRPGDPAGHLRRQRQRLRLRPVAAGLRGAGHPPDPLPAGRGPRAEGKIERFFAHGARPVPGRGRGPGASPTWPSSTACSPPGSRPSITAGCTPRPGRRPSSASAPAARAVLPTPEQLHEAFLWSENRTVTKTATVSLHGNAFEVDAALVGSAGRAGLRPLRPGLDIEVRYQGRAMGKGPPVRIGRHSIPRPGPRRHRRPQRPPASTTSASSPGATPPSWPGHQLLRAGRACRGRPTNAPDAGELENGDGRRGGGGMSIDRLRSH